MTRFADELVAYRAIIEGSDAAPMTPRAAVDAPLADDATVFMLWEEAPQPMQADLLRELRSATSTDSSVGALSAGPRRIGLVVSPHDGLTTAEIASETAAPPW